LEGSDSDYPGAPTKPHVSGVEPAYGVF